jgi:drug/metabolite transporter (DMT)-like permease
VEILLVMPDLTLKNNKVGGLYLIAEIFVTFVLASIVKILQPDFSVFLILFFRYVFCLPLLVAYAVYTRGYNFLKIQNIKGLVLRSSFGFLGLLTWFLAITKIDISLATALLMTMPIFIAGLSVVIAKEKVGLRRLGSVILGFFGVLVLLLPITPELNIWGAIFALLGALFAALMFVYLRILGRSDPSASTAIWYNSVGVVLAGILTHIFGGFTPLINLESSQAIYVFITLGVLASFQQFFLAQSHMYAEASVLAPLHYLSIPFSVCVGILFFDEIITVKFVIGTAIIIASTYYIFLREQVHN